MELEIMNLLVLQMIFVPAHLSGREYVDEEGTRSCAYKWCSWGKSNVRSWPYPVIFVTALMFLEVVFHKWREHSEDQL